MKKITIKGNKLLLEDGRLIYLTKEMIAKFSLKNKEEISDEELDNLVLYRLRLSAYNMLAKKDYFKRELLEKLQQKLNFPKQVKEVVEEFLEKGYINDKEKAYSYAKSHPNYGPKKLEFVLSQMGVSRETIKEVLADEKDESYLKIKELWIKLGNKEKDKKIASLMRKGFLYGDIKKAISSLEEEEI